MQIDQGGKGFSFMKDGPLDMRMDPNNPLTAEKIVNSWSEEQLGRAFKEYGEEPRWRKAARAIVFARKTEPIRTTLQLAWILKDALRGVRSGKIHPATLAFQALRICVNGELDALQKGLKEALRRLASGGIIGVISFQRLEDRIVKNIFRDAAKPPAKGEAAYLRLLTKKPICPSVAEVFANPRARSAKMRFAEKI